MRSSAVIALAVVAAAGPALSAPVAPVNFARAETNGPSTSDVSSEAISLGTISTIASFAAPLVGGIINHFKNNGNQKQRRDALELESLLARAEVSDESDAISLGTIGTIASFAAPLVGGIIDHFRNKGKRSDFEELLARAVAEDESSEAIKLGTVANVASIGSSIVSAFHSLFGREDAMELLARAFEDDDVSGALYDGLRHHYSPGTYHIMRDDAAGEDSEAIKLGTVANIASIGSSLVSAFHNLFGREDTMELLARASDDDVSAAISSLFHPITLGPARPRYRTRDDAAGEDSEAIKLGTVANVASIGSSIVSAFHSLFGRDDPMGVLARADFADDDSAAIVLRPGMQPIRVPTINGLRFHIGRDDAEAESAALFLQGLHRLSDLEPAQWGIKRDVLEFLARADTTEESDAIKLSTLGNIASIGGSIISAVHNLFSSNNNKRELSELLARVDEDSQAIKLSTLGNIASIGGSVISAIHNLFSSNNQGQKREFLELLSRATAEDVFQARSLNELD